jgi:antitoxin HicB
LNRRDIELYIALPYTIELTPDEDGFWFAEIPLLDGCMTNSHSREDALLMIDDAKRAWLQTALEMDIPIPEPQTE